MADFETGERKLKDELAFQSVGRKGSLPNSQSGVINVEQPGWYKERPSHEQLVRTFKRLIAIQQRAYQDISSPKNREVWPPPEIIRKNLDVQSGSINEAEGEFFSTLRYAWDALAYDTYDPGSLAEGLAGSTLSMYYQHCRATKAEPIISLTDPIQVDILSALAEAASVPYPKRQTEFQIDERHKNRTDWLLSEEYQRRMDQAKAKRGRG